jgi:hypothetical protein
MLNKSHKLPIFCLAGVNVKIFDWLPDRDPSMPATRFHPLVIGQTDQISIQNKT